MKRRRTHSGSNCAPCRECGSTRGSGCSTNWVRLMPNRVQDDDVLMSLVELALARPVDEREMYLRSACEGNCELFDRAWKYVQCEQRMNGFLLEPLCSPPALDHPFHV